MAGDGMNGVIRAERAEDGVKVRIARDLWLCDFWVVAEMSAEDARWLAGRLEDIADEIEMEEA